MLYEKRKIWKIEEKSGRHSATKKNTRSTARRSDISSKSKREYRAKKDEHEDLKDDEIIINIPITGEPINGNEEKSKKSKKKKKNKILKIILIVLITILVVFVTIFGRYLIKNGGNVSQAIKEMFRDAVGDQEPIFILVMGISEDISAELTDTIMLIGYNPDTNQAFVLSVPRDTFIGNDESRAGGFDKINALYQKDPQKTITAVENITGIKIDHYVVVKTSVLVKIVDTLGGVEFDVPVDMDYDDDSQDLHIHLKAGYQKLNGDQAEQLVRFRHNNDYTSYPASYGDNDEGRTRTQREFMKVVAQQVLSTRDVDKIKSIAKDVFDNLETNIKWNQAVGYIPYAIDLKMEELEMQQLPGQMGIMNKLWFFKVNKEKTEELINGYIQRLGLTEAEKKQFLKTKQTTKVKSLTDATTEKKNTTNTNNESKNTSKNNTTKDESSSNNKNTTTKNNTTNKVTNETTEKNNKNTTNTSNTKNNDDKETDNKPTTVDDNSNAQKPSDNSSSTSDGNESNKDNSSGGSNNSNTENSGSEGGGDKGKSTDNTDNTEGGKGSEASSVESGN